MSSEDPGNQADQPTDEQMTAEEYRQVARALAREERWEDLATLYLERAEGSPNASSRARYLVHAAAVFDKNMGDADRAYITYFAAFQDDPSNQDAVTALARVTSGLGRFPELLEECMAVAAQMTPPNVTRRSVSISDTAQLMTASGHHWPMVWLDWTTPAASRMPQTPRASSTIAIQTVLGFIFVPPSGSRWLS